MLPINKPTYQAASKLLGMYAGRMAGDLRMFKGSYKGEKSKRGMQIVMEKRTERKPRGKISSKNWMWLR